MEIVAAPARPRIVRPVLRNIGNVSGRNRSASQRPCTSKPKRDSSCEQSTGTIEKENSSSVRQSFARKPPTAQSAKTKPGKKGLPPIPAAKGGCSTSLPPEQNALPDISTRKFIELKRWYCTPRPQHPKACGITSLVGCWNYLCSQMGHGTLSPLAPEQALTILGYDRDISKIPFGQFTGNKMILKWFGMLCEHFGVKGRGSIFWKRDVTSDPSEDLLGKYMEGVRNPKKAFIYHCHNHYCTPIGYEVTPNDPALGYAELGQLNISECEPWIIIGETSRKQPAMHVVKWKDVVADIMCKDLYFYNIRERFKGMQIKRERSGNNHCFMLLEILD